jgi:two-component system KDP operon response regulator KdpE
VLIVDDDYDTREALGEALGDAGFVIGQAASGAEALRRIAEHGEPDVILLDLRMPEMDGEQFLERVGKGRARVIILTAEGSDRILRLMREARLLSKPIDLDSLEAAVKEACAA